MNDKYKILQGNHKTCKRMFGIKFGKFVYVLEKVQAYFEERLREKPISNRGLKSKMGLENQLLLALEYLRQYPTFLALGSSYGISEGYANKVYHKIRPALAEVIGLKNPEKLKYKDVKNLIIDVTVQPIERPEENQKIYYNRYKKNT